MIDESTAAQPQGRESGDGPRATGEPGPAGPATGGVQATGFVPVGPDGVAVPVYAAPDRPRGLDAPFAPGGDDDASPERVADERRLIRLLVVMVALVVGIPTLLTIIAFVGQLASLRGGG
jgi:hypothetical protein